MTLRPPALIFGIPIDDLTMAETLDLIGDLVVEGRRERSTRRIATANVDFLVNTIGDPEARRLLQNADMCIADGMPVVWAAKASGVPLRERVAGADLVPAIAERAATAGWTVHLFGSTAGTAERSVELLTERFPGARITGDSGPIIKDIRHVDEAILDDLIVRDPDVLCVALGNPKQERFINLYPDRLRIPVMIGIGGSLDMLVGDKKRAPEWVQRIGMEWMVRALQEPGRLGRRYAHDAAVFGPRLMRFVRTARGMRDGWSASVDTTDASVVATAVPGAGSDQAAWSTAADGLVSGATLDFRFDGARTINVPAAAQFVGLSRIARRLHAPISVSGVEPVLELSLRALEIPDGYITSQRRAR